MPKASPARLAGGAAAEANSIPAAVAEYCKEMSEGGRNPRAGTYSRTSGQIDM